MSSAQHDDDKTQKLQRQLTSKDDDIRSYENKLFMANNDYNDLSINYKDALYRSSRESERANKLENDSIKHTDEIKKLKLQLANCQTTMESSDAKLRGLQSSESSLEKRLNSSHSNHDAIKLLESRLDSANSNLKDATTDKTRLSEKMIEIQNQLMASESLNKKLREEIDDNVMQLSSHQNTSSNRRDSVSIKEILNSQIESLNEKLSKSQQDLNMAQNQLMALTRSSKREIEQLREEAQDGHEAQKNLESLLAQSDSIQGELDKKTVALESAQNEVRQLQLQLIQEQSRTSQSNASHQQNKDDEMSISELEDALSTPVSKSALNMSSNSKLLAEISRLMAMIHRLRADRDENLGRAHFSETELKFSQQVHQKDLDKHETELSSLVHTRNELTEELKNSRITCHEYEEQMKKIAVQLEQTRHESNETTKSLERSLSQAKVQITDMEQTDTQNLIKIDAATAQYKALQDSYSGHRERIVELETALKTSQEEAQEFKEDLQDWEEHHLTLQEGAVGIVEKLQDRLNDFREKLQSAEVNYGIAQDRVQSITVEFDKDRMAYEARIDEIDSKFNAALESEHERAKFTDSRLSQLTDMSNTIRENFNQTRLKHSEEIKNLRNEHAIELSKVKQSHQDSSQDRNRQVEAAIQIHEDHHDGIISDLKANVRRLGSEKNEFVEHLAGKEQVLLELKAQHAADIEKLNSEKQRQLDETCKKFDEKLIQMQKKNLDDESLGEVMVDDAKNKEEYHTMEIQYEERIRELVDQVHKADEKVHHLETKLNESLENVAHLQNMSAGGDTTLGNSTLGNSTLRNLFEQSANQTREQSMRSSVGGNDTLNNLFREGIEQRNQQPSQSFSGEVVDIGSSSEDEPTSNNTINNSLFATGIGLSMGQAAEGSMSNESRGYFDESVMADEVLNRSENHRDGSIADHSTDATIAQLFAERQPTHDELRGRIMQLERQLREAIAERDEKLNEAVNESEKRIRILYEEFKKADQENEEKQEKQLHALQAEYITHEMHESKLHAMAQVIFATKKEHRVASELITDLQNKAEEMAEEHAVRVAGLELQLASVADTHSNETDRVREVETELAAAKHTYDENIAQLHQQLDSMTDTRSERVKEVEAELSTITHDHSERIAELQQQLTIAKNDHATLSHEFDGYKSQKDSETENEKRVAANIETELEVLRQDRISDNIKLEEITTLLEKITREYEHKQEELNRLIDTHDGEVEHQKQLLLSSHEQSSKLTRSVEDLEKKLRSVEEGRNEVDSEAYEELREEHKVISEELKALQEEREQFTQQLDSSTKLIEESRVEYDTLLKSAKNERSMLNEQITTLNVKLEEDSQLRTQLEQVIKSKEDEMESKRLKLDELLAKVETDQTLLREAEETSSRYSEVIEQLKQVEKQLNENVNLVTEREAEIFTLNDALSTQSAAIEDIGKLEAEIGALTQQRDEAITSVSASNAKVDEYKVIISSKEEELVVASNGLATLESEKEELLNKVQNGGSGSATADAEELEEARERIQQLESGLESAQQMTEEAEDKCLELEKTVKRLNSQVDRLKAAIKEHPKPGSQAGSSKKDDDAKVSTSSEIVSRTRHATQSTQSTYTTQMTQKKSSEASKGSASPRANAKKRLRDDDDEEHQPRKNPNPSQAEASPATRSRKKSEPISGTPQKRQPSLLSKNKAFTPRRHASQPHSQPQSQSHQSGSASGTTDSRDPNSRRSSQRQQNSQNTQISDLRGRLNQFKRQ
ncbi:hypothetical protein E3P92_00502 [Wallemia ichthyophaga]|nr:hypothetical protein E3P95_00562 [Wallemia ichthyophaga]TIB04198.1 hypothetical protein E3P94_00708 [Wallemia ichthyophaga]TIB18679.1 hypothetical protein E3P92_00502 [Wallemia ichthyophaga]